MNEEPKVTEVGAQPVLSMRATVRVDEIALFVEKAFAEVMKYAKRRGIQIVGPPFALYRSWSASGFDMEAGFPVAKLDGGEGGVKGSVLPSGRVSTVMHLGRYENLRSTYSMMERWIISKGYKPGSCMWEVYLNSPEEVSSPEGLRTQIFWPIE